MIITLRLRTTVPATQKKSRGIVKVTGPQPRMEAARLSLVLRLWNQETSERKQSPRCDSQVLPLLRIYEAHEARQLALCMFTVCKSVSL